MRRDGPVLSSRTLILLRLQVDGKVSFSKQKWSQTHGGDLELNNLSLIVWGRGTQRLLSWFG